MLRDLKPNNALLARVIARAAACTMLAILAAQATAQTSFPMIMSTFPTGVQRGKTTDVTINCQAWWDLKQFYLVAVLR